MKSTYRFIRYRNVLNKILYPFMIKHPNRLGIEGNFYDKMKFIYRVCNKCHTSVRNTESFTFEIVTKTSLSMFSMSMSIQHHAGGLSKTILKRLIF